MCVFYVIKILPDGDLKPQAKHLQTRTEYLLRVLQRITLGESKSKVGFCFMDSLSAVL